MVSACRQVGMYSQAPFVAAANTPRLRAAYDQLVGQGRWQRPGAMGSFVVRFPSESEPHDAGWHVDVSFGYENSDFMEWRANIVSRGRMLLMLFLFSDVGGEDGPTRIRAGSHHIIARQLAKHGDEGLTLRELAKEGFSDTSGCKEVLATGTAGTVYLCHPFLVHSAQAHKGQNPRFLAQPPLLPIPDMSAGDADALNFPVGQVIAQALCG
nr:phytanoyl-CoA dioxygenase family protein [Kordiimonas gwangyangensis]